MTVENPTQLDEAKLEALVGSTVGELAAAVSGVLALLGDRLGLYGAMAGAGPMTASELAERTGTAERYVREWLHNQAAGGIVDYDPRDGDVRAAARAGDDLRRRVQPGLYGRRVRSARIAVE